MNEELVFNSTRLDISRSAFPIKRRDLGTGFVGRLNTLRPFEVLPGSSYDINCANLVRFTTPGVPVMDDLYMDVYFYYCSDEMLLRRQSFSPSLLDGNHSFAAIMGAQDGNINMPFPDADLKIPAIEYMAYRQASGDSTAEANARVHVLCNSLLDMLGYPLITRSQTARSEKVDDDMYLVDCFNCLPLLGYLAIWNEDFREPNLQNRFVMTISASNVAVFSSDTEFMSLGYDLSTTYGIAYGSADKAIFYDDDQVWTNSNDDDTIAYATPLGVSRFHGLFGSLLPWPQRNSDPVYLPLGELAPVYAGEDNSINLLKATENGPLRFHNITDNADIYGGTLRFSNYDASNQSYPVGGYSGGTLATPDKLVAPANLWADLRNATSASINTIRAAFQTQKWFEALARGGNSDLDEYINSLFGVVGDIDVVSKRPVYLGGKRIPININQVNNTAGDLGETGAFSLTSDNDHYFKWHSKTYGMIYCVFCIRHSDMFADAPQKFLLRRSKFDFYFPQFANLGEEGYSPSLMAFDAVDYDGDPDETPIGYQEYAADYRYDFNALSGQFRFSGDNSWHYATLLEAGEFDLKSWLDASFQALDVDRTLKTPGSTAFMQFYYDFQVYGTRYLPMPVSSIPGLVDHH